MKLHQPARMFFAALLMLYPAIMQAQQHRVTFRKTGNNKIDVLLNQKPFTSFLFPDTLEKPVLYPLRTARGTLVTRGFPLAPRDGEPTDHPHHIGLWLTFENVNGLDFWNNSYAIPEEKKRNYGWIKTDSILEMSAGKTGTLRYHANWVNQANDVLLEELTTFVFSGTQGQREIIRTTQLTAKTQVEFKDAKDGLMGIRVARELQLPEANYITSEGKQGDDAWSSRAQWCKLYGKLDGDSVSITIFDDERNPNYPSYWHARGYGLFAINPLGENIFTDGSKTTNLQLKPGESVTFRYRVLIENRKG